ncbi:uncharacterized protein LOC144745222 [Ciona intestinalis]
MSSMLTVCNTGSTPTFVTKNRAEVLDLTLCTNHMSHSVTNWKVHKDTSFSDHRLITFQVDREYSTHPSHYRNVRNATWDKYVVHLDKSLSEIPHKLPTTYSVVVERAISSAFECSCRLVMRSSTRRQSWWSAELTSLRKLAKRSHKKALRSKSASDWSASKEATRAYKAKIRSSKRASWRKFCSEVNNLPAAMRLHRVLKGSKSHQIGSLRKPNGEFTSTPGEALNVLFDAHFPDDVNISHRHQNTDPSLVLEDDDLETRIVTEDRVREAIKSFDPYKSAGLDKIYPILLQRGIDILVPHLKNLYSSSLKMGHVPSRWNEAKVVFPSKPEKEDYTSAKSPT